ncbi:predicted protein [Lichtheimia corymbifera JMRC:FSU:9682]|uniref:Uncharacterized protein n=1 Tax=Lichtheimia corymbifera JMRC:FSU:9682 TaxID=1263082 RepID=A0A068S3C7_9FUNG|nr:predicted protein [Lichtheimia corymbifera JMRC:FSU:9682]
MDFSNVPLIETSLMEEQDCYFDQYDRAMEAARLSADIQDYYLWQQREQVNVDNDDDDTMMMDYQEEENNYYYYDNDGDENMMMEEDDDRQEEESSYNNEALLSLIAGVQSSKPVKWDTMWMNCAIHAKGNHTHTRIYLLVSLLVHFLLLVNVWCIYLLESVYPLAIHSFEIIYHLASIALSLCIIPMLFH